MDFIINPTGRCNFACTFCAASKLSDDYEECSRELTAEDTIRIINPYKNILGQLIFNGGDPLMMDPSYYFKILDFLETLNHKVTISLTTNLYDFYRYPYKWEKLFKTHNVGVITSFQYGGKRRLKDGRIFSYQMFIDTLKMFKYIVGYKPNFIAVVDRDNEDLCKVTLETARDNGIKCKLNKVVISGKNKDYYPRYRMFEKYIELYKQGLGKYEMNFSLFHNYFNNMPTYCPIEYNCYKYLRCINPDGKMTTCSYVAENYASKYSIKQGTPANSFAYDYRLIKNDCLSCRNFKLCNSCRVYIKEVKDNQDEANYCANMKKLIPQLKELCK